MENLKKLSRAEMKNVLGGVQNPACKGLCGDGEGTCATGCVCNEIDFPDNSKAYVCE